MKDLISAVIFFSIGITFLLESLSYNFGNLSNMGPGFFPAMISITLIFLSIFLAIKSYKR